ncbi:MAG: hypothetical protein IJG85_08895 [Eubacteriaceae bacterium]|nr:hypothetical protein [Eubacteriaceae bacterium]
MNSRNFIVTVAVAIAFFAACFVWEARGVLSEGGGKEISVGSCNTLRTSSLLPDACSATPEVSCETSFFYQTIHFECGCKQTFVLISGCVRPYSESACTAKDGHLASLSEEGIYVDDTKIGNCGGKNGYYCETAYPGQNITLSHDFDPECPHGSCSKKISIYPCHQTDDQVPNLDCGTKREIKIGC